MSEQNRTVWYSTVQHSTEQCVIVQYGTVRCSTVQYSTVQYSTEQWGIVQYETVRCGKVRNSAVQYKTAWCTTVQYRTNHTAKIVHDNQKRGRIDQESNTVQHQSSEDGLKYNASPCSIVSCRITLCCALQLRYLNVQKTSL